MLGVTTKTVRHYETLGLLGRPERSQGGYRLYSADDLLRLREIRRLQSLGLPLKRVREFLGTPGHDSSLRSVLQSLLDETSKQIDALEQRRARIERMLSEDAEDALDEPWDTPPTMRLIKHALGEQAAAISPRVREQGRRVLARLDGFGWGGGYPSALESLARRLACHPDLFRQLLAIDERLAALADQPEDSPEVERLVEDFARFREAAARADGLLVQDGWPDGPLGRVLARVLGAGLSQAQRRFLRLLEDEGSR